MVDIRGPMEITTDTVPDKAGHDIVPQKSGLLLDERADTPKILPRFANGNSAVQARFRRFYQLPALVVHVTHQERLGAIAVVTAQKNLRTESVSTGRSHYSLLIMHEFPR